MSVEGWGLNDKGKLNIGPVVGFETATAQMIGLLRLRFAMTETEFETGGQAIRVHMTPVQLRGLAQALQRMAETIEAQYLGTKQ